MTTIQIYNSDAEKLHEAASKIHVTIATLIEWLVEEGLDEIVKEEEARECGFCIRS